MTSDRSLPSRFTEIDELTRPDHSWLTDTDRCYSLGEYTARQGYTYSATNNLIQNFKKKPDRQGKPEWRYKEQAILRAARAFRDALNADARTWVFVPVPPSKMRDDPLYDDRMTKMLRAIWPDQPADVRELIIQTESTAAAHESQERPTLPQLQVRYRIDETVTMPEPAIVAIVDDVLTTGAHFRAASAVLTARFPAVRIVGLFIARRVPEDI